MAVAALPTSRRGGTPADFTDDAVAEPPAPPVATWFKKHRRELCDVPKLRKEVHDNGEMTEEVAMHEDWLELFTDLLLVAFYMNLSAGIAHHGIEQIPFAFLSFFNIFNGMWAMTEFINMYVSASLFRLVCLACVPGGTCLIVSYMNLAQTSQHAMSAYSLGFSMQRLGLAFLYYRVWWLIRGVGVSALFRANSFVLSSVLFWMIDKLAGTDDITRTKQTAVLAHSCAAIIELCGFLAQLPCSPLWYRPRRCAGVNIGHLQARMGIAVMVALGESVIQFLTVIPEAGSEWWRNLITGGGFLLTMNFALIYFDSQPHEIEHHVLSKSWSRAVLNRFLFPFVLFSIFLMGVGFELVIILGQQDLLGDHSHAHASAASHGSSGSAGSHASGNGGASAGHEASSEHAPHHAALGMVASAAVRRLSGGGHHLASDWTLDSSLILFSLSVGTVHFLMTWSRHVHAGLSGLRSSASKLTLLIRILIGCMHLSVGYVISWFKLEGHKAALVEVWAHVLLTVPVVFSVVDLHEHTHGHGHEEHGTAHHHDRLDEERNTVGLPEGLNSFVFGEVAFQPSEAEQTEAKSLLRYSRRGRSRAGSSFALDPYSYKVHDGHEDADAPQEGTLRRRLSTFTANMFGDHDHEPSDPAPSGGSSRASHVHTLQMPHSSAHSPAHNAAAASGANHPHHNANAHARHVTFRGSQVNGSAGTSSGAGVEMT